jgi:class 3 adenylate cyclase
MHDRVVRDALAATNGREIKHTGDGIMAVFTSASSAIRCGMDVLRKLSQHNAENPDEPVQVRIGVAAGEPIEHHADLFGSTVQLAARLCAHAEPEQILASRTVAELCLGKSLPFKDLGPIPIKGFDHPVHVHSISCA